MFFRRIEIEYRSVATVVRLCTPPIGGRYDDVDLRDELTQLILADPRQQVVVDFGDHHMCPAEVLASLAHIRRYMASPEPIRCVNLPLRLQFACRLLRFEGPVLKIADSLESALANLKPVQSPQTAPVVPVPPGFALPSAPALPATAAPPAEAVPDAMTPPLDSQPLPDSLECLDLTQMPEIPVTSWTFAA